MVQKSQGQPLVIYKTLKIMGFFNILTGAGFQPSTVVLMALYRWTFDKLFIEHDMHEGFTSLTQRLMIHWRF